MNLREINRRIAYVKRTGSNFNDYIQETAVGIIEHAMGEGRGDVTAALRLCLAMPKSFRRGMLVGWFKAFAGIRMTLKDELADCKVSLNKPTDTNYVPFNLDGAKATKWYEFNADGGERGIDTLTLMECDKSLSVFVKRFEGLLKGGKIKDTSIKAVTARVNAVKALIGNYDTPVTETNDNKAPAPVKQAA